MSTSSRTTTRGRQPRSHQRRAPVSRIAAGVNGFPEGNDAVALGEMIARATGAELMLVAVHTDPLVVLPEGMNWKGLEEQAQKSVRDARDALAPDARVHVETDLSVGRALQRVVKHEHRDLLVVGSNRHAVEGEVRIGKRTRQLLDSSACALAVAPRGMSARPPHELRRIGVGFDAGPEAHAALKLAASVASSCGAQLVLCGVIDDRVQSAGWARLGAAPTPGRVKADKTGTPDWDEIVKTSEDQLMDHLRAAAQSVKCEVTTEVRRGRPADRLVELAHDLDLIVIGSRRWGQAARLILGSTGEGLMFHAPCPVMVAPRPRRART
jgi:nucleotide-binding universal stress UspA family protein